MNILQNKGIFASGRRIKSGPEIISRKTKGNINEINVKFDNMDQSRINEFFSKYDIKDYSLNDEVYVFDIDSNNQESLDTFVREVGWLGKDGNYVRLRGIPGAKDSERFADEADGYGLSNHVNSDGTPLMITEKPIEDIIKEVEEEPEIKGKFFSEEEINKMHKTNRGLTYAVGTLALFTALNITTNLYMDQEARLAIDRTAGVVTAIHKDIRDVKIEGARQYNSLDSKLNIVENSIVDSTTGILARLDDVEQSGVDNYAALTVNQENISSKIDTIENTIVDSTTGVLARLNDVEQTGADNYAALTTNQEDLTTKLSGEFGVKTDLLNAQLEDVMEQKATSPWYLIKTGAKATYDFVSKPFKGAGKVYEEAAKDLEKEE